MRTTGARAASASPTSRTPSMVAPARSACAPAAWTTGPSASGSEYGTPSSSRSAPLSRYASPIARDASSDGKPPMRYGMSAATLPWEAKASAMRRTPAPAGGAGGDRAGVGAGDGRSAPGKDLREVLVAAAREADEIQVALALLEHPGERMRGLERRDDALDRGELHERRDGLLVGHRLIARASGVAQEGVLGPAPGVVEAGGDRVRLGDLAVVVLQHRAQRAVQDAGAPGDGQRRAMAARVQAVARRLDADQLDLGIVEEAGEHPDRVGAAADARDHAARQAVGALGDLRPRPLADGALQLAHDRGIRGGAHHAADDVVRRLDVGHPVADRGARRLLERHRPRLDGL